MTVRYDILIAGELNPDLVLSDPNITPRFGQDEILVEVSDLTIGSSSAIFACGAARLGLHVGFVGVLGDDLFGRFMLEALAAKGVDIAPIIRDPSQTTGISVILNRGEDRAILTHTGAISALRAEQVTDELLSNSRHLHVASFFLQQRLRPGLPDLFRRARALGLSTSLDPNRDPADRWEGLKEVLSLTDVFLPNELEALALTGKVSVTEALRQLRLDIPWVAIKRGAAGAIASHGQAIKETAPAAVRVVDTVGAGDSFDAGFIYGFLHDWTLERMLNFAVICGSLSTRALGGTAAQPDLEEIIAYLTS